MGHDDSRVRFCSTRCSAKRTLRLTSYVIVATVHTLPMTLAVEPAKANRRKTRKADREGTMFLVDGRYMFVRGSEG